MPVVVGGGVELGVAVGVAVGDAVGDVGVVLGRGEDDVAVRGGDGVGDAVGVDGGDAVARDVGVDVGDAVDGATLEVGDTGVGPTTRGADVVEAVGIRDGLKGVGDVVDTAEVGVVLVVGTGGMLDRSWLEVAVGVMLMTPAPVVARTVAVTVKPSANLAECRAGPEREDVRGARCRGRVGECSARIATVLSARV